MNNFKHTTKTKQKTWDDVLISYFCSSYILHGSLHLTNAFQNSDHLENLRIWNEMPARRGRSHEWNCGDSYRANPHLQKAASDLGVNVGPVLPDFCVFQENLGI